MSELDGKGGSEMQMDVNVSYILNAVYHIPLNHWNIYTHV